jgi:hypothetical protein
MAYVKGNPQTKKILKEMFKNGNVELFSPGLGEIPHTGIVCLSGPHYPKPHRWYAEAKIVDGKVVKII